MEGVADGFVWVLGGEREVFLWGCVKWVTFCDDMINGGDRFWEDGMGQVSEGLDEAYDTEFNVLLQFHYAACQPRGLL